MISDSSRPNVTSSLKQLLSVAKLHYRKNMVKCPCGHVCGSPNKSQSKAKIVHKPSKTTCNDNKNSLDMQTVWLLFQQLNIFLLMMVVLVSVKYNGDSTATKQHHNHCQHGANFNTTRNQEILTTIVVSTAELSKLWFARTNKRKLY